MLQNIEKALVQVLLAKHIVEDSALLKLIETLKKDFGGMEGDIDLAATFTRINKQLKRAGMEVRSVTVKQKVENDDDDIDVGNNDDENNMVWVKYHGISNSEEDLVSKEFGSSFTEPEVKVFADIIPHLLKDDVMSYADVERAGSASKLTRTHVADLLSRLESEGWMQREQNHGWWQLGLRSHLELKGHLESVLLSGLEQQQEEEATPLDGDELLKKQDELRDSLPTVLLY
jgi:hypothetical protein